MMQLKNTLAGLGVAALIVGGAAALNASGPGRTSALAAPVAGRPAANIVAAQGVAASARMQPVDVRLVLQTQPQAAAPEAAEPAEVARTPEPTEVAGADGDNVQQGDQTGPDTGGAAEATQPEDGSANETADAQALASQARITRPQAEQAALASNRGTTVVSADLGDENGAIVYDVQLSNGSDVKVSATTGAILGTDTGGNDGAQN